MIHLVNKFQVRFSLIIILYNKNGDKSQHDGFNGEYIYRENKCARTIYNCRNRKYLLL